MEILKIKMLEYIVTQGATDERRLQWNTITKENLENTLQFIANTLNNGLTSGVNETRRNMGSVFISFDQLSSGISETIDGHYVKYHKIGAELNFSQLPDGNITVFMYPSYIEGITLKPDAIVLEESINPSSINEVYIKLKVGAFLDKLTANNVKSNFSYNFN